MTPLGCLRVRGFCLSVGLGQPTSYLFLRCLWHPWSMCIEDTSTFWRYRIFWWSYRVTFKSDLKADVGIQWYLNHFYWIFTQGKSMWHLAGAEIRSRHESSSNLKVTEWVKVYPAEMSPFHKTNQTHLLIIIMLIAYKPSIGIECLHIGYLWAIIMCCTK